MPKKGIFSRDRNYYHPRFKKVPRVYDFDFLYSIIGIGAITLLVYLVRKLLIFIEANSTTIIISVASILGVITLIVIYILLRKKFYKTNQADSGGIGKSDERKLTKNEKIPRLKRICKTCGASMILREAKKGRNKGTQFFGCSNFGKGTCDYTEEV